MAKAGDVLVHPITGERITFLQTSADTNGTLLQVEIEMQPNDFVTSEHIHPRQEERMRVLAGTAQFQLRGWQQELSTGQDLVIPAGMPHFWWNSGDDTLCLIVEYRPALQTEAFFESLFHHAHHGSPGLPHTMQTAVIAQAHQRELQLTGTRGMAQRMFYGALAPVARSLGYRRQHTRASL
jgi:quercetin dioxygenase-like cupin family protein